MVSSKPGSLRTKISPVVTTSQPPTRPDNDTNHNLIAVRYESVVSDKLPFPVTVAPPRAPPSDLHPALRRQLSDNNGGLDGQSKRDSGLAPTTSTAAREGSVNTVDDNTLGFTIDFDAARSSTMNSRSQEPTSDKTQPTESERSSSGGARLKKPRSIKGTLSSTSRTPESKGKSSVADGDFSPITTPIPTEELMDEDFLGNMSFSKRGSIMLDGKKGIASGYSSHERANPGRRGPSISMLVTPSIKVMSDELVQESKKVRSMYEQDSAYNWRDGNMASIDTRVRADDDQYFREPKQYGTIRFPWTEADSHRTSGSIRPETETQQKSSDELLGQSRQSIAKSQHELAGGLEDWEDVNGGDVDRYGFITLPRSSSRGASPEPRSPQRASTLLLLASAAPRKRRPFTKPPLAAASRTNGFKRLPSRNVSARSLDTQASSNSHRSSSFSSLRAATNRLPGYQDRRWMDEAGDMLTLPPGLADIAEDEDNGKAASHLKKKEWERTEKWRKMAKLVKPGKGGEGMEFEFDTRSPKLIERTWKGIPDRWRGAAWYSFLANAAQKHPESPSEAAIISSFHKLLDQDSADDVQIDIDVPRTICSHIMFRRRYRGGQRLLFRVLHCLSLYFPDTGYVQGMACLAATLLCYYDEEKCFVMLVRLWMLRGLKRLYESGFGGLMDALEEWRRDWLRGEVAARLTKLNIEPTAYGTRWYLTLFNYSIPFAAQLRIWDVFMLSPSPASSPFHRPHFASTPMKSHTESSNTTEHIVPDPSLSVLHAASTALIDGTREILLDSDFENAMKVLTGWIPIKDEELLMRVARAEWRGRLSGWRRK